MCIYIFGLRGPVYIFTFCLLQMAHSHLILFLSDYNKGVKCQFKKQEQQNGPYLFMRDWDVYTQVVPIHPYPL